MPRTIDFRDQRICWGHNIVYTPHENGRYLHGTCWVSQTPRPGDYVLISIPPKPNRRPDTRYRVISVKPYGNPRDMYKIALEFAPRAS